MPIAGVKNGVRAFGSQAEKFWSMQERVADAVWDFSARVPAWPVASLNDALQSDLDGAA